MLDQWRDNEPFCNLAEFHWPSDYKLAKPKYLDKIGRAKAIRRMRLRFEGFGALPRMVLIAERIAAAARKATATGPNFP